MDHTLENKSMRKSKSTSDQKNEKPKTIKPRKLMSFQKAYWTPALSINSETNVSKTSCIWESKGSNMQLMPTINQQKQTLRKSLSKLKSSYWNECLLGLQEIIKISQRNPELLDEFKPVIYKGVTTLLQSLRPTAERAASQAAKELFMNGQTVQCPEFEELVHALLQKTADNNPCLRKDVLEALNSMVAHVAPSHYIKIFLHKKTAVCNLAMRTTLAKLLARTFERLGTNDDIVLNEEMKTRLVQATIRFLQDNCNEVKYNGVKLVTKLLKSKEYEPVLLRKVSIPTLKRINKIIDDTKKEQRR